MPRGRKKVVQKKEKPAAPQAVESILNTKVAPGNVGSVVAEVKES